MTETTKKPFHIIYACDSKYVQPLIVSLTSLAIFRNPGTEYAISLLLSNTTQQQDAELLKLAKRLSLNVSTYNTTEELKALGLQGSRYITPDTFMRFYIPSLYHEVTDGHVLYLDPDTIINGDLYHLRDLDIEDKIFDAVDCTYSNNLLKYEDKISEEQKKQYAATGTGEYADLLHIKSMIGENGKLNYFNAGVMLWNIKELHKRGLNSTTLLLKMKEHPNAHYLDQDVLNMIAQEHGGYHKLSIHYNFFQSNLDRPINGNQNVSYEKEIVKIIHCTGKNKPWLSPHSKVRQMYVDYLLYSCAPLNI